MGVQKKKCSGCREFKPATAFHVKGKYPSGKLVLSSKCKVCLGERSELKFKPKTCPECGDQFSPRRPLQKYCGPFCEKMATTTRKKSKPATRTEKALVEFERNKIEIRQEMIEDRGFVYCQRKECQKSVARFFHFHHIIFRSEKPNHPMIHSKKNLIHVCDECHDLFHDVKGTRNKLVVERWLDKIFGPDVLNK